MNRTHGYALALATASGVWIGCGLNEGSETPTGIVLGVAVQGHTGADVFRSTLDRVPCTQGEQFEALHLGRDIDVVASRLAGSNSGHELFADELYVVPAGCYDVAVESVGVSGVADECATARASAVRVDDGQSTEIILVLQCAAPGRGGLGVTARLNHAPMLRSVELTPGKTLCEAVDACAVATDEDGDSLELEWSNVGPIALASPIEVVHREPLVAGARPGVRECVRLIPVTEGEHDIEVKVFDLFDDGVRTTRVEELAREELSQTVLSRDELQFKLHVSNCGAAGGSEPQPPADDGAAPELDAGVPSLDAAGTPRDGSAAEDGGRPHEDGGRPHEDGGRSHKDGGRSHKDGGSSDGDGGDAHEDAGGDDDEPAPRED